MKPNDLDRRQFQKLTVAALGRLLAGATVGLAEDKKETKKDPKKDGFPWLQEPHICRGTLQTRACKGEAQGRRTSACSRQSTIPDAEGTQV